MRTLSEEQLRAHAAGAQLILKVVIEDENGTPQEWTNTERSGPSFIGALSWGETDEDPMMTGEAEVIWHHTEWTNLSPFNDAGSKYAGWMHDGWPVMTVSLKTVPQGADPADYDWIEAFEARVDDFNLSSHPGKVQFRERVAAELMDDWILENSRYGNNDGDEDVEDVMREIITDHDRATPQHTLEVPVPTALQVREYNQAKQPILLALRAFSLQLGWDLRTKWHEASGTWRLTLYEPDRSASTPVHTFTSDALLSYGEFSYSVEHVRNAVRVYYGDATTQADLGEAARASVVRTASTTPANDLTGTPVAGSSIAKRRWRFMELSEGATSLVQTEAQAASMAEAAISDLADPTVLLGVKLAYVFCAVEINDFIRLEADGVRFGTDQDLAVRGYQHTANADGCTTTLTLQGKPGLGRGTWTAVEARPGKAAPPDNLAPPTPSFTVTQEYGGSTITVDIPRDKDFDQFLFYEGSNPGFTPSASNLVQAGRQKTYYHRAASVTERRWIKVNALDIHGNYSGTTSAISAAPKRLTPAALDKTIQAKSSVGLLADKVLAGYGTIAHNKVRSGGWSGAFSAGSGTFSAHEGGTYRVALQGRITTTMTPYTDFEVHVVRDPSGDNEIIGRAVVSTSVGGVAPSDFVYSFDDFVPLDAGDTVAFKLADPGGGTFASATFDYQFAKATFERTMGTQTRSVSQPLIMSGSPVFLDRVTMIFSFRGGIAQDIITLADGNTLFVENDAATASYAASIIDPVTGRRDDELTISGSTDYWFSCGAQTDDGTRIYLGAHKDDATTHYGVRGYEDGAEVWTSDDLGATHTVRGITARDCADGSELYICTDAGAAGYLIRYTPSTSTAPDQTSGDMGGPCNGLAHLNPSAFDGGRIVTCLVDATTPDVIGAVASDLNGGWTLELDVLSGEARAYTRAQVRASNDAMLAHISVNDWGTIVTVDHGGSVVWTADCEANTAFENFDATHENGVEDLAVHPTTGDVYALFRWKELGLENRWEVQAYDARGAFLWSSMSADLQCDLADDTVLFTSGDRHCIAVDAAGDVIVSDGATAYYTRIRPLETMPANIDGLMVDQYFTLSAVTDWSADDIAAASAADVTAWSPRTGSAQLLSTGSPPSYVPDGEASAFLDYYKGDYTVVYRTSDWAALLFDGTESLQTDDNTISFAAGATVLLAGEFLPSTTAFWQLGTDTARLVDDGAGTLVAHANEDIAADTTWTADDTWHTGAPDVLTVRYIASLGIPGIWQASARPQTAGYVGTNPTPDAAGQFSLSAGLTGWVARVVTIEASASTAIVTPLQHWLLHRYAAPAQQWSQRITAAPMTASLTAQPGALVDSAASASAAPEFAGIGSINLSAKDFAALAEGTAISSWVDRHANARDFTQATGANQPVKRVDEDGRPYVSFEGNDYLDCALATFGNPVTIFVRAKYETSTSGTIMDGLTSTERNVLYVTSGSIYAFAGANSSTGITDHALNPFTLTYEGVGASSRAWRGRGLYTAAGNPGTQVLSAGIRLGAYYSGSSALNGRIYEVVIYDGDLSDAQREEVWTWMESEWEAELPTTTATLSRRWSAHDVPGPRNTLISANKWPDRVAGELIDATTGCWFRGDDSLKGPSVDIASAGAYLQNTLGAGLTQPVTIAMVTNVVGPLGNWSSYFDGSANRLTIGEYSTAGTFFVSDGVSGPNNVGAPKLGPQMLVVRFDGSSSVVDHDGDRYSGLAVGTTGIDKIRWGANSSGGYAEDQLMSEGFIWDGLLTDTEVDAFREYVHEQWATPMIETFAGSAAPTFSGIDSYNWSAKTLSGYTDDDRVGRWNCRHSGIDLRQDAPGLLPKKTTVSGVPAMRFDNGHYMQSELATAGDPVTIFVVGKIDTGTTGGRFFVDGMTSTTRNVLYQQSAATEFTGFAGTNLGTGNDDRGAAHYWMFDGPGASTEIYKDGVLQATGNAGTQVLSAGLTIGADYTGASGLIGEIYEIIIYKGALSAAQIADVETHISSEWSALGL